MGTPPGSSQDPPSGAVTVLVVDDSAAYLAALRDVVEASPGFALVGEARTGEQAVELATRVVPDLVLMDIRMPGLGGIEAGGRISARRAETVIMLLSSADEESMPRALGSGACAAIDKRRLSPRTLAEVWAENRPGAGGGR